MFVLTVLASQPEREGARGGSTLVGTATTDRGQGTASGQRGQMTRQLLLTFEPTALTEQRISHQDNPAAVTEV